MKNKSVKLKISIIVILNMFLLGSIITIISVNSSLNSLTNSEMNKLTTLKITKKYEITNYFNYLKGLLTSLASNQGTKEAFLDFEDGFYKLSNEIKLDLSQIKNELKIDFENNYLNSVNYEVPNSKQRRSIDSYIPKDTNALIAQYIFITNNKEKLGEKNNMNYNKEYDSTYMRAHKKYHSSFDSFLTSFELYDIFMVDLKGNLIYTDFKEKDFATNLKIGVYSDTGIAKVYKKALELEYGELAFNDFAPYEPSYNSAASFIATPIFINGIKKGVLIFQMPVDAINNIMSFNGDYEAAGLGQSGECYLVGQDYKMRNNSRFTKDINDPIVQKLNSTIGVWEIKTDSTKEVMSNKSNKFGNWIIDDYRGVSVLSAYSKIDIYGQTSWAIVAEIDEDEALLSAHKLEKTMIIVAIVCILLSILILRYFINQIIAKPISKFQDGLLHFFKFLNREKNTVELLKIDTKDEFGVMADIINENIVKTQKSLDEDKQVINSTIKIMSEFEQGDLSQRIDINSTNPTLNELTILLNKMGTNLENNIGHVLSTLDEYTQYDYTKKVSTNNIKKDLLVLATSVNLLGDSITEMLVENKKNGLTLEDSSNKLMDNVNTLNKNSSESATALEEIVSALGEITSNISNNTENVVKMSGFARELSTSASSGEELANQTTIAMDEIDEQVTSINDAITVIDQIAFQTNILSLNAAVEAATAGEAGKGFAVVAQEVRNLASKSAEAASEIKTLVQSATDKANTGKVISKKMIGGYNDLNQNISKTLDLISGVETASKEQMEGIQQINGTINSLDQQTQQNASIASQTQSIAQQTDGIAKLIVTNTNEKEFDGKN
ncbi:methyl-accepting chemotaxis protein [Arcobacter sp. LA11]|uniref:methyl-accepting chemotaxis protein n=1 Tax=Arcobacter sp. LA11 TaxID=1898176 RepID=UPI000933102A|nr:methyl-accepting chemotaxis protein [Arcobacter sp. LA11]